MNLEFIVVNDKLYFKCQACNKCHFRVSYIDIDNKYVISHPSTIFNRKLKKPVKVKCIFNSIYLYHTIPSQTKLTLPELEIKVTEYVNQSHIQTLFKESILKAL